MENIYTIVHYVKEDIFRLVKIDGVTKIMTSYIIPNDTAMELLITLNK